jgi:hypothetical protein
LWGIFLLVQRDRTRPTPGLTSRREADLHGEAARVERTMAERCSPPFAIGPFMAVGRPQCIPRSRTGLPCGFCLDSQADESRSRKSDTHYESLLAPHPIPIPIQVPPVPRIPHPHRRRASRPRFGAVAIGGPARTRRRCERTARRRRGGSAMTVVLAGLAVGVTPVCVQSPTMRDRDCGQQHRSKQGRDCQHAQGTPPSGRKPEPLQRTPVA